MAGAGAGAGAGPQGPEAQGGPEGAALEARLATLEAALAGEAAELEAERAALAEHIALAERSVRAREASVEEKKKDVAEARPVLDLHRKVRAARRDPNWRDWAGLPEELMAKIARAHVAQTEAGWAAQLKKDLPHLTEEEIQEDLAQRKCNGNCLFVFARVCKGWRKAQLKVGAPLRTRVGSDVILPGSAALAKWALAEGCPRQGEYWDGTMAHHAALYGNLELVKWLCGEGGFAMDEIMIMQAARGGNLELVQWLRGEGCPGQHKTCHWAVEQVHVEVLRWARENGCQWGAATRDRAAAELGYTDDLGNLRRGWY